MTSSVSNPAATGCSAKTSPWRRRLTSPWAAVVVLGLFWAACVHGIADKSMTSDESVHAYAGFTYWKHNDYRIDPENGNLPQRIMGLPLALAGFQEPPRDGDEWRTADKWNLANTWFYQLGNRAESMLLLGRSTMALVAVALGLLIWWWSRLLFGPTGGMVSLLVYVLSPSFLANGPLMTSDATCALFFLAASGAWWAMLQRMTVLRAVGATVAVAGLALAKMSAALFLPMAAVLVITKLVSKEPLWVGSRRVERRWHRALWIGGTALVQGLAVWGVIWAAYGFRFETCNGPTPPDLWAADPWEHVLDMPRPNEIIDRLALDTAQGDRARQILAATGKPERWSPKTRDALAEIRSTVLRPEQRTQLDACLAEPPPHFAPAVLDWLRRHRLLPEAYLYGHAHALHYAEGRLAFFNGAYRKRGWIAFFPYTFLVKTPLPTFGVMLLALGVFVAAVRKTGRSERPGYIARSFAATLPLWTLFVFYWIALLNSHLNIGHRHMLATYPPLFVLCGAAARVCFPGDARQRSRLAAKAGPWTLAVLLVALLVDVGWQHPHHLAYFNGIVRSRDGWRHLVDSSLDWGQDLPGLKHYLEARPECRPAYLSYFGTGSPRYRRIPAFLIPGFPELDRSMPVKAVVLPADSPSAFLASYLEQHPEFDPALVGTATSGGVAYAVLIQRPEALAYRAGTYCISATMLQLGNAASAWGPWTQKYENAYWETRAAAAPLVSDDLSTRQAALRTRSLQESAAILNDLLELSFRRLACWLRKRDPDDSIGGSILIYHLSEADLRAALEGPPAELVSESAISTD